MQSGGKWMREKVIFRLFLIRLQGSVEDELKIGKGIWCRESRHGVTGEELIHRDIFIGEL